MTITALTTLHLKAGSSTSNLVLCGTRLKAKRILESALDGKRSVYWYQQTEDPSYLYIVCDWASVTEYREQFVPSEFNKELIELLQDEFYPSETKTILVDVSTQDIPVDAPLISIGFHKLPRENKEAFERRFHETRHLFDEYVTREKKGAGGWRFEKDNQDQEEWVLFIGWESWEQHFNFIKIDAFKEYGKILKLLNGYESRHARMIDLN